MASLTPTRSSDLISFAVVLAMIWVAVLFILLTGSRDGSSRIGSVLLASVPFVVLLVLAYFHAKSRSKRERDNPFSTENGVAAAATPFEHIFALYMVFVFFRMLAEMCADLVRYCVSRMRLFST